MSYKTIRLKKGKESSLLRFHPWVFSGAIENIEEGIEEGDTVRVVAHDGTFLAVGHYQIGSIAVRVLSFEDIIIDGVFWRERLQKAYEVRKAIGVIRKPAAVSGMSENINTTYRLVHGEGDNLPGLVIDIYDDTAVMQAHSVGMHVNRQAVAEASPMSWVSRLRLFIIKARPHCHIRLISDRKTDLSLALQTTILLLKTD